MSSLPIPFAPPIKRDEKLTYAQALSNGENFYSKIQEIYQGAPTHAQTFTQDNLNNGWSRVTENILPDEEWDGFFHEVLDRLPGRNEVSKIAIIQDQPFTNANGRMKQGRPPAEVPPLNRFSDAVWTVWSLLLRGDQDVDDDPENKGKHPIDASRLRYIGYDSVNDQETLNVIEEMVEAMKAEGEGHRLDMGSDGF
ncbi:MAG: hypothetical protein LQ352_002111 [Teloschistes flavicans]|nr:MAG: hypothetical protein LQ352_002111 [Teloschistes flavicans]